MFTVEQKCLVREAFSVESEQFGFYEPGRNVAAVSSRYHEASGVVRVQCADGWMNQCSAALSDRKVFLEPTNLAAFLAVYRHAPLRHGIYRIFSLFRSEPRSW